jgi:hypothetical protein
MEITEDSDDKQEYSDLLKRLEKSERIPKERETREALHTTTPLTLTDKQFSLIKETPSGSFTPSKTKPHRSRSAGLGGPVISSGLAGLKGKGPGYTKTQKLSITGHNFHINKPSPDDLGIKDYPESSNKDNTVGVNTSKKAFYIP